MKDLIRFSRYTLEANDYHNPQVGGGSVTGAVVEYRGGYGCLQVWPELGDETLEHHLDALRSGNPTVMGRACINCCMIDGDARRQGIHLLSSVDVRKSHYLLADIESADLLGPQLSRVNPGDLVKIKGTSNLASTISAVEAITQSCHVRIDFNMCLDNEVFCNFMRGLTSRARRKIQFIEDPFPYDPEQWQDASDELGVELALDWGPDDAVGGFAVRIWKPSRQMNPPAGRVYCITHNMDHVIGRNYAAYKASLFNGDLLECGLGEIVIKAEDTGFGCNKELESMEWEKLNGRCN
ncbi:MAG: hypothetical protein MK183_03575 [Verrucomicrobiales bacterium]|nr:hypothetical protein [Verrucomicrobiales bacterium]